MNTKGQGFSMNILVGAVVGIVMVGLIGAFGLQMLGDTKTDLCATGGGTFDATDNRCENATGGTVGVTQTYELNATKDAIEGVAKIPAKLPLIAGAIVVVVVIALLVRWFKA